MVESLEQSLLDKLHAAQETKNSVLKIKALLELSEYYFSKQNYEKSQRALLDVLEIDSKYVNVYYYLAIIYVELGDNKKALEILNKELKNHPKNSQALLLKEQLEERTRVPTITISLLILNIVIFLIFEHPLSFLDIAKYSASNISIDLFSTITSMFFHINMIHLIFNLFILIIFGLKLERNIGSLNFLLIYFISGIIGNGLQALYVPNSYVVGASGALFGLMGALVMREPLLSYYFLGIFKIPIIIFFGGFFSLLFIFSELFLLNQATTEIAHFAGLVSGIFIAALLYSQIRDTFYYWIIIALGFWIASFSIGQLFFISQENIKSVLIHMGSILISIGIIIYSYNLLARKKRIGRVENG